MPYTTPTVSEFKSQFPRDFPYAVPAWGAVITLTLTAGVVTAVALRSGGQGYKELPTLTVESTSGSGCVLTPTILAGKVATVALTNGGSGYSSDARVIVSGGAGDDTDLSRVTDTDLQQALFAAGYNTSQALFDSQARWSYAYNYLAAHMLVEKLLAAGEGLVSQYNWLTASKSVGSMQEAFAIPDKIMKDPFLAPLSKTRYGATYLTIIAPQLCGAMFAAPRRTLP